MFNAGGSVRSDDDEYIGERSRSMGNIEDRYLYLMLVMLGQKEREIARRGDGVADR